MNPAIKLTIVLLIYFTLGAGLIFRINTQKDSATAWQNWIKFLVYLGLVFFMFALIEFFTSYFRYASLWIIIVSAFELIRLEINSIQKRKLYFSVVFICFFVLAGMFYSFSTLEKPLMIIAFFTVSAFDAFSQMAGQIFGRLKIVPKISPNKTVGGFLGGFTMAILTALFVGNILEFGIKQSLLWGICIALSSFIGDLAASMVKRKYEVKDFSQLIPGHGGYLDRFDSFIFAGAVVSLISRLI